MSSSNSVQAAKADKLTPKMEKIIILLLTIVTWLKFSFGLPTAAEYESNVVFYGFED